MRRCLKAGVNGKTPTRGLELTTILEEAILGGQLRPGKRLDELSLAERYKVSRTPVREALKHLAAAGLVELRPRQGAIVARPTLLSLIEMFETMAVLEGACAGLAARRHTAADRAAIAAAHNECLEATAAEDPDEFYRANVAFHDAIFRAAHNTFLEAQALWLRNRLEPYRRQITFHPGRMALSNDEHAKIMGMIFAMDVAAADELMRSHLDTMREDAAGLVAALTRDGSVAA
jgi:DNA-binding GntR family transcriptional regulator